MMEEKLNSNIFDPKDVPDFSRDEQKFPWGITTGTGNYDFNPQQDTGTALKETAKLAQQQAIYFQQQMTDRSTQQRLNNIEDGLKTILNMLKLILGTQLERELRDKEKERS